MISRSTLRSVLLVGIALALTGCSNIYESNIFAGFDGPPAAADLTDSSAKDIAEAADSPQFIDELKDDPDAREEIQERLREIYNDPDASEEERKTAAALSATIEIETSDGAAVVNNVVDVFLDEESEGDFSDPGSLVKAVFPESVRSDPEALAEQIESFNRAAEAYEAYGTDLTDENQPEGTNSGEVAQRAAVAILIADLSRQAGGSEALAADISNDDDFEGYSDPTESTLGDDENPTSLRNILDVAGLTGVVEGS